MPELHSPAMRTAVGVTLGSITPDRRSLSGGYRYRGNEPIPGRDELSPRELVDRLHAQMVAARPELAPLVAEYEQKRDEPAPEAPVSYRSASRQARMADYNDMRLEGFSRAEAAGELGLAYSTSGRYEEWFRAFLRETGGVR